MVGATQEPLGAPAAQFSPRAFTEVASAHIMGNGRASEYPVTGLPVTLERRRENQNFPGPRGRKWSLYSSQGKLTPPKRQQIQLQLKRKADVFHRCSPGLSLPSLVRPEPLTLYDHWEL